MNKKSLYTVQDADNLSVKEVVELYKNYINPNQSQIFSNLPYGKDLFKSAEGVHIYTNSGKKILDFTGGLGVLGLGHNHSRILEARIKFQQQNKMEVHKILFSNYMAALSKNMATLLPGKLNKSFFLNSGAEAVEAAIKVCFKSYNSNKKNILFSNKSYHGKLIGSGSISGSYLKNNQFPLMKNCVSFNFNDPIDLEEKILKCQKDGGIYAVIVEPYSASLLESCSQEFIDKLFSLKKQKDFRIIYDEVFTGFFKSKKMFYFENFKNEYVPDVICLSKTLGGGKSSISCLVVDDLVYNKAYSKLSDTFLHTTTYNGFAEESLTALEALNIISEDDFKNKVQNLCDLIKIKLEEIKTKHKDKIEEIKGTGLLNGIIFKSIYGNLAKIIEAFPLKIIKDKAFFLKKLTATAISCELYEKHNILTAVNDSVNSNHLCVSPSLVIAEEDVNHFFTSLDSVLKNGVSLKSLDVILNFVKSKI
tara:strand:+ start:1006 stop:2436 length:1431 start_codon:yes stop_codon:yes gene_type:complete